MKRLIVMVVSVSLSLGGFAAVATAQDKGTDNVITDASGASVTSTAGLNPVASGEGSTIVYGDINTGGEGRTVIAPPTVIQNGGAPAPDFAPAPEPAPVAEAAPEEVVDNTGTDTAVTVESDLDADNYPDALEYELGLDPNNIDTDGDGVADGDELNIYGTDPTVYDADGDGVSDGSELFDTRTDPLVWDDFSGETAEATDQQAAAFPQAPADGVAELAQQTSEVLTANDGNAAALGTGNASASPGSVTKSGTTLLGPDGSYSVSETTPPVISVGESGDFAPAPVDVVTEPVAEAVAEPAPEEVVTDTAVADTAVANEGDADGDNYPDALEYDLGLDPYNIDSDGDGVADGDELNIYGTDPTIFDLDGDGVSDGAELYDTRTDPLVWDDFTAASAETAETAEAAAQ